MSDSTQLEARKRAPAAVAGLDLYDCDQYVVSPPHEKLKKLREHAPVYWNPAGGRGAPGFWALTRYDDVVHVSTHPNLFSSWLGGTNIEDYDEEDLPAMRAMMLTMDPPDHSRYRRIISRGFTPRMTKELEPNIRRVTRELVDKVAKKGKCDFVADLAVELPLQVIAELLGVPLADRQKLFDWSNCMIGFDDPEFRTSMEQGRMVAMEIWGYANELIEQRQNQPGTDLISVVMNGEVDGERISVAEMDAFFLLLTVAGNETTRNLISGAMHALFQHPDQLERLYADPSLMPTAVEEFLRWVTPVMYFRRTLTEDTEIRGVPILKGEKVAMYHLSANFDEAVFPDPFKFDVARQPNEHLTFGIGEHYCMGAHLARLEIQIFFEEVLGRLKNLKLESEPRRLRSNFINGVKEMQVSFTPER
ncbi:MAG: cytochrome P450 [bacterium]